MIFYVLGTVVELVYYSGYPGTTLLDLNSFTIFVIEQYRLALKKYILFLDNF